MIDGRCAVSRCIKDLALALVEHVGGDPTPPQLLLIRECAIKNARLGLLVDKILAGDEIDIDLASRVYLAWSNSMRRDLEALGIKREQQLPATLAEVLHPKKVAA